MSNDPGGPEGIGTPATDQPGFAPPASPPPPPASPPPGPGWAPPGPGWAPPDPGARIASTAPAGQPPTGRPPQRRVPRRRALVAAVLAGGLLLIGLLSAQPLLLSTAPSTASPSAPEGTPVVVTVSPSAAPTAASTLTAGGGIGQAAPFSGADGEGTLTVTGVTWTDVGEAAPVDGERYLVVDLTVACSSGVVPVDPILFTASTDASTALPGFGPALTRPLGGSLLAAGDEVSGQLGFAIPAGPVELALLDEDLHTLVTVQVPGP